MKRFSEINVGVVGIGFIGLAHIEALRRIGVNVVGVVGSSPDRARERAELHDLPPVYDSVETMASDPKIDAVHIASPNNVHAEQVVSCIDGGKHVVCEKPLALTSADSADLVFRAKEANVVNAVCFNLRFYPNCHQAMAMVAQGDIGRPTFVTGGYLQDWLLLDTDWNWRLVPEEAGQLRAVADIGSHWLDLSQFITGQRITDVLADLHTFVPTRKHPKGPVETFSTGGSDEELIEESMSSDDAASIMLRFEDGARGLVAVSQTAAGRKNSISIEVDGSDSALSWFSENPDLLWFGHRGRPNELLQRDPSLNLPPAARVAGYPAGHVEGYPDTFRALFHEVYSDIASGVPSDDPTYPTFADGHDILRVTEAVSRSAGTQQWTQVNR
ncbi:MAG: Gfo/Idh/MocA family protein [Acidimicrobiia bacterium]